MTEDPKLRIALLGLGLMGSAIARRLVETGWDPIVWNRSPERAAPFLADGVRTAASAAEACASADIIFMVPINYAAGFDMLGGKEAAPDLSGKTLIQLANGDAADAREMAAWAASHSAKYLDANIMCYPASVGSESAVVVYCGDEATFKQAKPVLSAISGSVVFGSADPSGGNALVMAMSSYVYGAVASFFQACLLCEAEGQDLGVMLSMIKTSQAETDSMFDEIVKVSYSNPKPSQAERASLLTHLNALQSAFQSTIGKNIDTRHLDQTVQLFQRLADAGYGNGDLENAFLGLRSPPKGQ